VGANFKDFQIGKAGSVGGIVGILVLLIFTVIAFFVLYKIYHYYLERRKWQWFLQLCKEKHMSPKEVLYLKSIVARRNITTVDELYGSIYSMNLPTPIKKKLLWEDTVPTGTPRGTPQGTPRGTPRETPRGTPRRVAR